MSLAATLLLFFKSKNYGLLHPLRKETFNYLFLVCVYNVIIGLGHFEYNYLLDVFISMDFMGS